MISFYPLSIPSLKKVLKLSSSHDKEGDAEVLLPNQIQVHSPMHSKASLLTPGCGKGKHSVYCRVQSKESGQLMFKRPSILMAFREGFLKTQCEGGGFRAYHQLVLKSANFV